MKFGVGMSMQSQVTEWIHYTKTYQMTKQKSFTKQAQSLTEAKKDQANTFKQRYTIDYIKIIK